jgi:hypothetical protein
LGDRRQQMQKEDGQIAHRPILARSQQHEFLRNLGIRHTHGLYTRGGGQAPGRQCVDPHQGRI